MKKTMTKAVTLTATATMLISTVPFTATSVLAGESKYPAIATYNEIGTSQTSVYDELQAIATEVDTTQEVATQDLEIITPEAPELDTKIADSGEWGTCTWSLDDGVLTISGGVGESVGASKYQGSGSWGGAVGNTPWWKYTKNNNIKKIVIKDKITFEEGTDLSYLFAENTVLEEIEGLDKLDISNVTDIRCMFTDCNSLKALDLSNFEISAETKVAGSNSMAVFFSSCSEITMPKKFGSDENMQYILSCLKDLSWIDEAANKEYEGRPDTLIEGHKYVLKQQGEWGTCKWSIKDGVLTINGGTGASTNGENGYSSSPWQEYQEFITKINIVDKVTFDSDTNLKSLFNGLINVEEISGLDKLDTTNVTDMSYMFSSCSSLKTLDLTGLNTKNVTDINHIFYNCNSLTALDLSVLNTENVTDMSDMLGGNSGNSSLTSLNVSGLNTKNVTNMSGMFSSCSQLTSLDLSGFNTENVTSMSSMFYYCENLKTLNLSGFDLSNIASYYSISIPSNVEDITMPNNFGSEDNMNYIIKQLKDGVWKDETANKAYEEKPDKLVEKHNYKYVVETVSEAEGEWGTCKWSITDGVLTIDGGVGLIQDLPWDDYKEGVNKIEIAGKVTVRGNSLRNLFAGFSNVTEINGLTKIKTSSPIKDVSGMFSGCSSLKAINLSSLDFSKVAVFYNQSGKFSIYMQDIIKGCDQLEKLIMPSEFISGYEEETIDELKKCMSDVSWTDRTDKVKYDGVPDTLVAGHKYVVTGSAYDNDQDDENDKKEEVKDDTNKDDDNTGKDDTGKDDTNKDNNTSKDDTNKDNNNTSKDDTNKDDNTSKDDTNKDNNNTSKDDTNKDDNTSKDDTNKDNSDNSSKDDVNKDDNNTSDDTNNDVVVDNSSLSQNTDGNWYYYVDGNLDTNYAGLAENEYGWWKITNGTVDFGYNGIADNKYGWWKVTNGTVDFSANGLQYDAGTDTWWYFNNGAIDFTYTGLAQNENGWWKVTDGKVDFTYNGLGLNEYGWWKVTNGAVDLNYNGLAENEYGWWKVVNGVIDFSANGLQLDEVGNKWWYFNNGAIDFNYNGLAENEFGWWKITDGTVDLDFNGMAENQFGWWKVTNGAVDLSFNGMAENEYGWWYLTNGTVDFGYNGVANNQYGWWKITNGAVDFTANGLIFDAEKDAWFYFNNGAIDFEYTGLAENEYGWWKIVNGTVDLTYTGLAENQYGWWYFNNGVIDFTYNGQADNQYGTWNVVNGHVEV